MDLSALPSELLVIPKPLIGFSGLDIKNSIHKSIWDVFNNNRKAERASIQFKLIPSNYEFPKPKPKRPSYEWYFPKGILKRNWMLKHLHVLPAVVVLFLDLEWNDPQWPERQVHCANLLQELRNNLQDRNTRIALVLLQKNIPQEDLLASERAASLTNACGITNKMMFILPHNDHLMGYILRLESAFLEMAQTYYATMSKTIRSHREQLATPSHVTLRIRHQFKLGFVAEMRSDFSTALKHYSQAYATLDDIKITDQNCLEIKTVAGFLNYKICRLMFKLNIPRDSINQFMTHIEKYKEQIGYKDLIFEHYAWLSMQNSTFADLFCEAIKNGLPALQTQHPGIYYHKASEYIVKRRNAFRVCCSLSPEIGPTTVPISTAFSTISDFFGMRSTRSGEIATEQQIIATAQEMERAFNHSAVIIHLLGLAMNQYKQYRCMRFKKKITIEMAKEYHASGDHSKALTLYSLMLPDYREDKWMIIFSDVLLRTLRCALLSASVTDFIQCSIESLSPTILCDQPEKIHILENLWKVFQGVPPVSQSLITPEIRTSWEQSLSAFKSPIFIYLEKLAPIFDSCLSFEKSQLENDQPINIHLVLKNITAVPLRICGVFTTLTDGAETLRLKSGHFTSFNELKELRDHELPGKIGKFRIFPGDLLLEPGVIYKFVFSADSTHFIENSQLYVSYIEIHMGTEKNLAVLVKNANVIQRSFKNLDKYKDLVDNISWHPSCYIVPTFHLNTMTNFSYPQMLVNEYFHIVTSIANSSHSIVLQNVGMSITIPSHLKNKVFLLTEIASNRHKLHSQIQIDIGDLSPTASSNVSFYVFSVIETNVELQQKIWYTVKGSKSKAIRTEQIKSTSSTDESPNVSEKFLLPVSPMNSNIKIEFLDDVILKKTKEESLQVTCAKEFTFSGRFYTLDRKALEKVYRGENFLLRANIKIQSPSELEILDTYFICDHNLVQSMYSYKRKKSSNVYKNSDSLEDVIVLRTDSSKSEWITQKSLEAAKSQSFPQFKRSLKPKIPAMSNPPTDDGKTGVVAMDLQSSQDERKSRVIYNRAIDAIYPTGANRGFIKGIVSSEPSSTIASKAEFPDFGIYCVKWRRFGAKEENESKFVIAGIDILQPPLNIYCSIEEQMFVKVPMTLKVVLKNPSPSILHIISSLSVPTSDNFMCSGHRQLNLSIFGNSEKEIVFNLFPLKVGWQNLPQLSLQYNTQADDSKSEMDNGVLDQLVHRAMPKKVFVLPNARQSTNK